MEYKQCKDRALAPLSKTIKYDINKFNFAVRGEFIY